MTKSWNPDEQNTLNLESRYTGRFGDKSGNKLEARSTFKTMIYWTVSEAPPPVFEKTCHINQGASTAYVTFCLFLLLYKPMKMLSRINVKMITFTNAITLNLEDPHFCFWSSWGYPFIQSSYFANCWTLFLDCSVLCWESCSWQSVNFYLLLRVSNWGSFQVIPIRVKRLTILQFILPNEAMRTSEIGHFKKKDPK